MTTPLVQAQTQSAQPVAAAVTPLFLPTGNWSVNANGFHGTLHIAGVDSAGNLLAGSTIFGNPIIGFYDSVSARINLVRVFNGGANTHQMYNGYLFKDTLSPRFYSLAGEFTVYKSGGGAAQRINYG